MRTMRIMTWVAGMMACCMGLAEAGAQDLAMGDAIELPHAGVTIALPEGIERRVNFSPYQLVGGTLTDADGELVANVSLLAYPTHAEATAEEVGDNICAQLSQNLAFRDVEKLGVEPVTFAGLEGQSQLVTYTHRGQGRMAVNICAIRYYEPADINLCYVLKVEAPAGEAQQIADVAKPVLQSIVLTPIISTATMPVGDLGADVAMEEWGYEVTPPELWCVSTDTDSGSIYMGLMDHTLGGEIMPAVLIVASDVDEADTAAACVEDFIAWAQANAEATGTEVTVVSQADVVMAGVTGRQAVLLQSVPLTEVVPAEDDASADAAPAEEAAQTPSEGDVATEEGTDDDASEEAGPELDPAVIEEHMDNDLLVVYRVICVPARGETPARSYAMTLICDLDDAEAASTFLDGVAAGFSLTWSPEAETGSLEAEVEEVCTCTRECCKDHAQPAEDAAETVAPAETEE
jgi:hypothetical protein